MINLQNIKCNIFQIYALTEKNIQLSLGFKYNVIITYLNLIINLFMPPNSYKCLFLSMHPWLTKEEISKITNVIKNYGIAKTLVN